MASLHSLSDNGAGGVTKCRHRFAPVALSLVNAAGVLWVRSVVNVAVVVCGFRVVIRQGFGIGLRRNIRHKVVKIFL